MSPFVGFPGFTGRTTAERRSSTMQRLNSAPSLLGTQKQASFKEQASPVSDVVPSTGLGCTHLWLQSRVPLG